MSEIDNPISQCRQQLDFWHERAQQKSFEEQAAREYVNLSRALLVQLQALPVASRTRFCESTSKQDADCLAGIVIDSAIYSIQLEDASELGWGLLAMLFNNPIFFGPELWDEFIALHHSARKLNYDLEGYYRANRELALPEMQQALDDYFADGGRDLSSSGYKEGTTKTGEFTYTFRRSHER